MGDLVLRSRVSMLRKNLDEVKQMRGSVDQLASDIQELLLLPGSSSALAQSLGALQQVADEGKRVCREEDYQRTYTCLAKIYDGLEAQIADLRRVAGGAVASVQRRSVDVRQDGLGRRIQDLLASCADQELGNLKSVDVTLAEARSLDKPVAQALPNGESEALARRRSAWSTYLTRRDESKRVFLEYVDLLGGLALRDAGFDRGICRLVDDLFRGAGRVGDLDWSLTIPAREEAVNVTLARCIRVGFPEWTIWALPLAAHEFGHLVVTRAEAFQRILEEQPTDDARYRVRVCLADAFATYIMGPAYACAELLLRLEPFVAYSASDDKLTAKRAAVILRSLDRMDETAETYAKIRRRLRSEWDDALTQAGSVGEITPPELEQLDECIRMAEGAIGLGRAFPASSWARVIEFSRALALEPDAPIVPTLDDADLRYVLNGAWLCRLQTDDPTEVDEGRVNRIGDAAVDLWRTIEEAGARGGGRSGGGAPPRTGGAGDTK